MATKLALERNVNSFMRKPPISKTTPRERIHPHKQQTHGLALDRPLEKCPLPTSSRERAFAEQRR
jgi:hypothetical protein